MRIDPENRTVFLSAGELAAFRQGPLAGERASAWRTNLGRKWHEASADHARRNHPGARFETPIEGAVRRRGWRFELSGRIDQILPGDGAATLREVKTVTCQLPQPEARLRERFPGHFCQAAIYLRLARDLPTYAAFGAFGGELCLIDIDAGVTQRVALGDGDDALIEGQIDRALPFVEDRAATRIRLASAEVGAPFAEPRPGQAELRQRLNRAALESRVVLLEAPTGFGKTAIALEHALRRMTDQQCDRAIYLSSKSTGQLQTIAELRAMLGDTARFIQMRNRSEHRIDAPTHRCTGDARCNEGLAEAWDAADIFPPDLFEHGTVSLEKARRVGAETGICPHGITRGALPYADVWIGDANYVFSPASNPVFFEQEGFSPERSVLIVDEAHNLPRRAADALSVALDAADLTFALEEFRSAGAPRKFLADGEALADCVGALGPADRLAEERRYEALDLAEAFAAHLERAPFDANEVAPFALDIVWRVPALIERLEEAADSKTLAWSPKGGELRATRLDASDWIRQCLDRFGGVVLMSATLSPMGAFMERCGLAEGDAGFASGQAEWRESAYDVALDLRVDTRLRARKSTYPRTAETIAALTSAQTGEPVAVFFPSYQYAEDVTEYLAAIDPALRARIQPRGAGLADQETFIDEALLVADALFLVLGSSYAEGIDKLGGRVGAAMVVGPALPEVNAIQKARMDALAHLDRETAFAEVYIDEGLRKVRQALGRLVRAPGQKARVLLHGRRFGEPAYRSRLDDAYQPRAEIRSDADLHAWLSNTS